MIDFLTSCVIIKNNVIYEYGNINQSGGGLMKLKTAFIGFGKVRRDICLPYVFETG